MSNQIGHWVLRGYGSWALEEKVSGRWVGYSGLWNPHGWPEPEVMWGPAYQELGWSTLISCIAPDNVASQRVAQRLGATLERSIELKGSNADIYRHPAPSISNA